MYTRRTITNKTLEILRFVNGIVCVESEVVKVLIGGKVFEEKSENKNRATRQAIDNFLNEELKNHKKITQKFSIMTTVKFTMPDSLNEEIAEVINRFEKVKKRSLLFRVKQNEKEKTLCEYEIGFENNHEVFYFGRIFGEAITTEKVKEAWPSQQ
jgi:hypothetical protein